MLECVPNFSEGRDLDLVADIVSAIKDPACRQAGAKVVDLHSDPDHNRSVVTILGEPKEVAEAAFALTERAMQLLDVKDHQGEHPFIGVMDVIPFIPIDRISIPKAVELAREFGKTVAAKLALPVYFYGEAALITERRDLPEVRRGGYAALKQEISQTRRKPDIGRGLHPTAGAVAIGVRDFLIAFNINLNTNELDIAKSIAKNIREKSGGLPGVRALGMELKSRGITQVSINLTQHKRTGLKEVFAEVSNWAKEYEVEIADSELVGLLPREAVFPGMQEYLKLQNPPENKIIDNYL